MVFTLEELIYLGLKTEVRVFKFDVFHIGPEEETEVFKYGIKIGSFEEYISITRKCCRHVEGDPMDLKPEKYVKIIYGNILEFVDKSGHL